MVRSEKLRAEIGCWISRPTAGAIRLACGPQPAGDRAATPKLRPARFAASRIPRFSRRACPASEGTFRETPDAVGHDSGSRLDFRHDPASPASTRARLAVPNHRHALRRCLRDHRLSWLGIPRQDYTHRCGGKCDHCGSHARDHADRLAHHSQYRLHQWSRQFEPPILRKPDRPALFPLRIHHAAPRRMFHLAGCNRDNPISPSTRRRPLPSLRLQFDRQHHRRLPGVWKGCDSGDKSTKYRRQH